MKVFVSWSGAKSLRIAEVLKRWLEIIFPSIDFFISSNIEKGVRWNERLASELEKSNFGILCVTKDNFDAPWLLFEAGALSKIAGHSYVIPFLFDVCATEISDPLKQFQLATFSKDDIKSLVFTLNDANENNKRPESNLTLTFKELYPSLEKNLSTIAAMGKYNENEKNSVNNTSEQILQVALANMRYLQSISKKLEIDEAHKDLSVDILKENYDPRLAVCLCLDMSKSMLSDFQGNRRIDWLQQGVARFFDSISNDEYAKYSVEIAIVTFDSDVKLVQPFMRTIDDNGELLPHPQLTIDDEYDETALGEGINLALEIIRSRLSEYKSFGIDYYTPWLILMTDGEGTGSISEFERTKTELNSMIAKKQLHYSSYLIGDDDGMKMLYSLSPSTKSQRISESAIRELFTNIAKACIDISAQKLDEEISTSFDLSDIDIHPWDKEIER